MDEPHVKHSATEGLNAFAQGRPRSVESSDSKVESSEAPEEWPEQRIVLSDEGRRHSFSRRPSLTSQASAQKDAAAASKSKELAEQAAKSNAVTLDSDGGVEDAFYLAEPEGQPESEDSASDSDSSLPTVVALQRAVSKALSVHGGESPKRSASKSHPAPQVEPVKPEDNWVQREKVLIFMDWDDTLLPTSWLMGRPWFRAWANSEDPYPSDLESNFEDRMALGEMDDTACAFVGAAYMLGHLCCVTLAQRPWQERSMRAFMPKLSELWKEMDIEVHYANEEFMTNPGRSGFWCQRPSRLNQLERVCLELQLRADRKRRAMKKVLKSFYRKTGIWCNVVSLGDGPAERCALQELAFWSGKDGEPMSEDCQVSRFKTLQMLEDPDIGQLQVQLQVLEAWLPALVTLNQDFDISLADGEMLNACRKFLACHE